MGYRLDRWSSTDKDDLEDFRGLAKQDAEIEAARVAVRKAEQLKYNPDSLPLPLLPTPLPPVPVALTEDLPEVKPEPAKEETVICDLTGKETPILEAWTFYENYDCETYRYEIYRRGFGKSAEWQGKVTCKKNGKTYEAFAQDFNKCRYDLIALAWQADAE